MVRPIYILGPCSAETREQVLSTAGQLKDVCGGIPFIFRAGVWKPRTRPDTFQGVGEPALAWLAEVKQTFGIEVATEVATPEHAETALQAGIDYLWIGARTSANPIAVQAVSETIRRWSSAVGSQLPKALLIKNPVNADANLWLGNIERLEQTGIPVIAVHRGCNHQPCWSMAHQIRTARPDIPLLLDPSHMSGDARMVPALITKAEELGLDGAMVEVHCHPSEALSDKKQQITPTQVRDTLVPILSRLCLASLNCPSEETELAWLRAEIDELDDRLWETMAARMDVSRRIGEWKKAHGVAPLQPERFQHVLERLQQKGEQMNSKSLSPEFIQQVFELIHKQSLNAQI